jgi:hypothetical protein
MGMRVLGPAPHVHGLMPSCYFTCIYIGAISPALEGRRMLWAMLGGVWGVLAALGHLLRLRSLASMTWEGAWVLW